MKKQNIILIIIINILLLLGGSRPINIYAQTDTPTPTNTPTATATATDTATPTATNTPSPIIVSSSEPAQTLAGEEANLSVFGSNFTNDTTVRLVGFGLLEVTFINSSALVAELPDTVPIGAYSIEISDPIGGTQVSPNTLTIVAQPTATRPPATRTLTPIPPTTMPGQPSLTVTRYTAIPQTVLQGAMVTFSITIFNQGNRTALSPTAAFETGGSLIPSSAQTTITLPNIGPSASHTFTLNAMASSAALSGINSVVLKLDYRDFEQQAFNVQTTLTVEVEPLVQVSQLSLNGYAVIPDPVLPGSPVDVNMVISNTGTQTASQVRLSLPLGAGVLLAGPRGSSFSLGDIVAGGQVAITLPLTVNATATAGIQAQSFTLNYSQDGLPQTSDIQLTITVDTPPTSTILLDSYDYGQESIAPGERFTLEVTFSNIGTAAIENVLITFGYPAGTVGAPFSVFDGGGSIFVENIASDGGSITLSQEFISNGNLDSGVFPVPITLRYNGTGNIAAQEIFSASILVMVPPRIRFIQDNSMPEVVRIGDTVNLSLTMLNTGRKAVQLLSGQLIADNFNILTDENFVLQTLNPNQEDFIEATLIADLEGQATIRLELTYLNDLNQEKTLIQDFAIEVLAAPPARPTRPPQTPMPQASTLIQTEPEEHTLPDDFWERLLLGLLGLGR